MQLEYFAIVNFSLFLLRQAVLVISGSNTDRVRYFLTVNKNEFVTASGVNVPVAGFLGLLCCLELGHNAQNAILGTTGGDESRFVI